MWKAEGAVSRKEKTSTQAFSAGQMRAATLRAARLAAIKADIVDNLGQQALSLRGLASRHGLSTGYVRQLFAAEATTFTEFVQRQRLAAAYRMLGDARFAGRSISVIAFEAGFGDVAYFTRVFRRRYGMKPADARAARPTD